jgi:hypothetical protein
MSTTTRTQSASVRLLARLLFRTSRANRGGDGVASARRRASAHPCGDRDVRRIDLGQRRRKPRNGAGLLIDPRPRLGGVWCSCMAVRITELTDRADRSLIKSVVGIQREFKDGGASTLNGRLETR